MTGEIFDDSETTVRAFLHGLAADSADIEAFLNAVARLAVHNLSQPGEELLSGITLLRHKKAGTVASSSDRAQKMDEIQYEYSDGPCLRAAREQTMVHIPDLQMETGWPAYTKDVMAEGIRSILAVPIPLESGDSAGLNLYSDRPRRFDADALHAAEQYAHQASQALSLAVRLARHRETEADLKAALESRTTIAVAVGIIMGQSRCSQDEAIAMLKSASNTRNIKLRDLASDIVASTGTPSAETHFDK